MQRTKTIIRRWPDTREFIALFPEIPVDTVGRACASYTSVGQHGGADYERVLEKTEPLRWIALAEQAFLDELARVGYDVELCFRQTHGMAKARRLAAERLGQ